MKLLNRTIRNYLLYSTLLLLLCTPLFYVSIQHLFIREMDKVLRSHKKDFYQAHPYLKTEEDLRFFQVMNKEFILTPTRKIHTEDSLFTVDLYDSTTAEIIPHRVFCTGVSIQGRYYELQVRESLVNSISLITAIMGIQVVMLSLLLIGLVFINRKLSKKVWGPFYVILDRLRKYQIDDEGELNLPMPSTAEFRDLSAAITQLVQQNHEAYVNQKEFTENASHELQTPLAICRTKLELLAQTKELTQDQAELMGELFNGIDRMNRLNKNLLLLAKIENRQFFDIERIDLNEALKKAVYAYHQQALEKNLSITQNIDPPAFTNTNPILLDVLINNLVSNAIRHTPDYGTIDIVVSKEFILVSNSGSPLNYPEKIFQRFHRESRTALGSGLGLSIVKKVCDVSGYQILYSYTLSQHHFRIQL